MSAPFACRSRLRELRVDSNVGFYCIAITWQQVVKGSLHIMIAGIFLHVTVECRHLGMQCRKTVIAESCKPVGESGVVRDSGKKGQSICV